MTRISETELILPALFLLAQTEDGLSTTQLRTELKTLLRPAGEDLAILAGRSDTKFDQKVRNLRAHHTLADRGLAREIVTRPGISTQFIITDKGRQFVRRYRDELDALLSFSLDYIVDHLSWLASEEPLVILDERTVTEGELRTRTQEYRTRSRDLRRTAIEHYSKNGRITCKSCQFEFASAYPGLGDGYIQIHHLKPVSYMRGEELDMTDALDNVCPLCANCHQMVHRDTPPMSIDDLQSYLRVRYIYS